MMKIILSAMIFIFMFSLAGCGDDKKVEKSSSDVKKVETNNSVKKNESPEEKVKNKITEYVRTKYNDTKIDSITVNPHLGTQQEDDYVVLVYLTWNLRNSGETSKKMLDMYSSDMAARIYKDLPKVQELAVFWTVPYLNNGNAKISFERTEGGMRYTDTVFDKNFNK